MCFRLSTGGPGIKNAALQIALIILGVPLLAIALIQGHTLYVEFTRPPPPWPPPERIQFPAHHRWAKKALAKFAALPPPGRTALRAGIERTLQPIPQWLAALDRRPVAVLCVGENHEPYLRRFLADRLFATLEADVLLIEATAREAARIHRRVESGDDPVMLLGADMARLLRSALAANPALEIDGIEERPEQRSARRGGEHGSRESSIETNFRARYRPGRRHVVLYGAFHCSHRGGWLFQRLRRQPPPGAPAGSLLNLRVAWEHLEPPFEAFTYFLDEIGFPPGDFVIADPEALPAEIADWFPFLSANELRAFGAVAVFRFHSPSTVLRRPSHQPGYRGGERSE